MITRKLLRDYLPTQRLVQQCTPGRYMYYPHPFEALSSVPPSSPAPLSGVMFYAITYICTSSIILVPIICRTPKRSSQDKGPKAHQSLDEELAS